MCVCVYIYIYIYIYKEAIEMKMKQWTGSKLGKRYIKAVYCHPAYLIICRVYAVKCRAG